MPRPKGSKNKVSMIDNVDEKIAAVEAEIEKLTADLKAKKTELKALAEGQAEGRKSCRCEEGEGIRAGRGRLRRTAVRPETHLRDDTRAQGPFGRQARDHVTREGGEG